MSIVRDITDRKTIAGHCATANRNSPPFTRCCRTRSALPIWPMANLIDVKSGMATYYRFSRKNVRGRTTKDLGLYTRAEDRRSIVACLRTSKPLHQRENTDRRRMAPTSWGEISGVVSELANARC